jgi:hypothetical protein
MSVFVSQLALLLRLVQFVIWDSWLKKTLTLLDVSQRQMYEQMAWIEHWNLCQKYSSRKLLVGWVRRTDPGCSSFSIAGTYVLCPTILLFLHSSERYRDHQSCVSGTPGTGTFCISGTGTGFGSGSNSGTRTGFGSDSSIKYNKSQKILKCEATFLGNQCSF